MPRAPVEYEPVAAAAKEIRANGKEPNNRNVSELLRGRGVPCGSHWVQAHLKTWLEENPKPPGVAQVPVAMTPLLRKVQEQIEAAALAARVEVEAQLVEVGHENSTLAALARELEGERDALQDQLAQRTQERDTLTGQAALQIEEIKRLSEELHREQHAAEDARIEAARGRLALDQYVEQISQLRAMLEQLQPKLERESAARIEAERQHTAVSVELSALTDRLQDLQQREQAAVNETGKLRQRVDGLLENAHRDAQRIEHLERQVNATGEVNAHLLSDRDRLRAELDQMRTEHHKSSMENARLNAKGGG